jgi:adenine/guanine phosphoribosyltransferase-like PRPP-binding protein
MRRTRFLSLNIKLGLAGEVTLDEDRIGLHRKLIQILYPRKRNLTRIGLNHTSPFDYTRMRLDAAYVSNLINDAILESLHNTKSFDVLLIDFSNNSFGLLRDPILMQLSEVLAQLSGTGICSTFILLLPDLPPLESASVRQFRATSERQPNSRLVAIANDGDTLWLPKSGKVSSLKARYINLLQSLEVEVTERFKRKIVRRLGHFQRGRHDRSCRLYSYTADNCEKELLQLLKNWWSKSRPKPDAIVYDSASNQSLIAAIKALCESKKVHFYRLEDLFTIKTEAAKASAHKSITLVVDVIETGATVIRQLTKLKEMDVTVNGEVLAAISKGSSRQKLGDFRITSFAAVDAEPETHQCIQCQLGLPPTYDTAETFDTLRSFDFWYMADQAGWESERDIPDNIGEGYVMVPKFKEMVMAHGHWLAYKMERLYKTLPYPEDIFVIHPKEDASDEVSKKLRLRFDGQLSIVQVPRTAIKAAQAVNNSWDEVIAKLDNTHEWFEQLKSLSNARALITDIFNASGSTFQSLSALLKVFDIPIFCYFPLVDRDFGKENEWKYDVKKYSLYRWYGPRKVSMKK